MLYCGAWRIYMLTRRSREIWQGLVAYANSEQIDIEDLRKTILQCMPWAAREGLFVPFVLDGNRFPQKAAEYQPAIRNLLTALCEGEKRLPTEAFTFLVEHGRHVRLSFDGAPYFPDDSEHFEENRKYWHPSGEPKESALGSNVRSKDYEDIADPICDFILDELDRMREDEQWVPILVCKNPACRNLVMPRRIGKKGYCSDECKSARHRNEKSQSEKNDYQWLYRRFQQIHPDKQRKDRKEGPLRLDLARNKKNFERIKSEHESVPRIQKLIAKLERYT